MLKTQKGSSFIAPIKELTSSRSNASSFTGNYNLKHGSKIKDSLKTIFKRTYSFLNEKSNRKYKLEKKSKR